MPYIWESPGWPELTYELDLLLTPLANLARERGRLEARIASLGLGQRTDLVAAQLSEDALCTSC